jgi:hypothetical protein
MLKIASRRLRSFLRLIEGDIVDRSNARVEESHGRDALAGVVPRAKKGEKHITVGLSKIQMLSFLVDLANDIEPNVYSVHFGRLTHMFIRYR